MTATQEDFIRLEQKVDELLSVASTKTKMLLNSKDLKREFGLSEFLLRNARQSGELPYVLITKKDFMYKRVDVEAYIESKRI